ncbi:unnamed protein product [Fraxinus pennsylvanica]|uniref:Lipoxygenase domain-containing protein n=1 Tax=Fraxinus pennsylvanica TaxID=56036 RepID=A0AAD1YSB0_9LAMI|nr:unnamed protein product [Fraxinus pennsylvanica]
MEGSNHSRECGQSSRRLRRTQSFHWNREVAAIPTVPSGLEGSIDTWFFVLDYHDILLVFIEKINILPERKADALKTIFCYNPNGVLSPMVIELSLPFHFLPHLLYQQARLYSWALCNDSLDLEIS